MDINVVEIRKLSYGDLDPLTMIFGSEFNRTYREEVLDAYLFEDLQEVRHITEQWLNDYNTIRPHEALQGLPPRQYAIQNA